MEELERSTLGAVGGTRVDEWIEEWGDSAFAAGASKTDSIADTGVYDSLETSRISGVAPNSKVSMSGVNMVSLGDGFLKALLVLFSGELGWRRPVDALANFAECLALKDSWLGDSGSSWLTTCGMETRLMPLPLKVGEVGENLEVGEEIATGEDIWIGEAIKTGEGIM